MSYPQVKVPLTKHVTKYVTKWLGVVTHFYRVVPVINEGNTSFMTEVVKSATALIPSGVVKGKGRVSKVVNMKDYEELLKKISV